MERVETRDGIALETLRERQREVSALFTLAAGSLLAAVCAWALLAALARGCAAAEPAYGPGTAALGDNIRRGVYGDELCGFPAQKEAEEWR